MLESVKLFFNYSEFSDKRKNAILMMGLLCFFGTGGYFLTVQLVKYIDLLLQEKDKQIHQLTDDGRYKDQRYDSVVADYQDYIEKIRKRDDSITADDRKRYNEIYKK